MATPATKTTPPPFLRYVIVGGGVIDIVHLPPYPGTAQQNARLYEPVGARHPFLMFVTCWLVTRSAAAGRRAIVARVGRRDGRSVVHRRSRRSVVHRWLRRWSVRGPDVVRRRRNVVEITDQRRLKTRG